MVVDRHVDYRNPEEADELSGPILRAREALSKIGLKTTRVANGMFMDYFGQPNIPGTLRHIKWAIDVAAGRAVIPGTSNEVLFLTYSRDVGRFMARLTDDDEWSGFSNISGADTCLNEIVPIAEKVTEDKFHVSYDSIEDIRAGKVTLVSPDTGSYGEIDASMMAAMMGSMVINGGMEIPKEGRLNDKYPEIKPMSIEEMMTAAWSKK
ncbi:hypothetical protein QQX98_008954 [Neonectria punicea]|uniref:NmrA-like domain-containing protein n=1 Tax=Neonectria punicea TaxID=979145 RepID=A0ABR1GU44_9HYPO